MSWYKNSQLNKQSDFDWSGVAKGLGIGGGIGAIPVAAYALFLMGQSPTPQQAQQSIRDNQEAQAIIRQSPPEVVEKAVEQANNPVNNQQTELDAKETENPQNSNQISSSDPYSEFVAHWEGFRNKAYLDTEGNMTIGVGFNLESQRARNIIESMGLSYDEVYNGQIEISNDQVYYLLSLSLDTAKSDASKLFPSFQSQPQLVQKILVDMSFNLGYPSLSQFTKFRSAIENFNYQKAAEELIDSRWYGQVGRRSRHHVEALKSLANQR